MVAMQRAPLGMALQNAIMPGDQPEYMPHALPQTGAPEKPGFFKEGGMGRVIAGLIGDALLQQGGMRPVYSPMMRERQQMAAAEAQWSRRREAEREDKQWEWQNKPREEPRGTALQQNYDWLKVTNPTLADNYLKSQTTAPPMVINNPDGTKTIYPAGAIPQAPATLPADFDFGEGGPSQPATGGF